MDRFEEILLSKREEDCQQFLTVNNEILLSTFKKRVCIPKFKFGNEFVSDFVLFERSSLGCEVILIEIEPPTERPFTKKGKYARRLNDAIGQVNDWFAWISENEDYFLRTLSSSVREIGSPYFLSRFDLDHSFNLDRKNVYLKAIIIIGRRDFLSEEDNKRRAAVYQTSNRMIEITHFDRLLDTYQKAVETRRVNRDTSVDDLDMLSRSKFYQVRRLVATHENTSQATLGFLADDPELAVVQGVVKNRNTPYDILHKLVMRNDEDLNETFLRRDAVPSNLLSILFEKNNNSLRRSILEHPNCPEDVLISASQSLHRGYRRRAAQHPNLRNESMLLKVANDPEAFVRTGAAMNPNLPTSLLLKLSDDPDRKVYIAARYQNINNPEDALIVGLDHEGSWVRSQIAKHPNLKDVDVLKRLATDESWWVRVALAENRNLPPTVRKILLNDSDERVIRAARSHAKDQE